MKKKILIVGNGAKEYAFAKILSKNNDIYITPTSDTLKEFATCLDIRENNVGELLEFVMENGIDLTIATSEIAIKADIATFFADNKQQIFAPNSKAANIIYNKCHAKKTLYKLRIPTPKFGIFEKFNLANEYIKNQQIPFVIKTNDNNSASIITSPNTAKNIMESIFQEKNRKVIIEDYIYGTPFSFYTLTDGYKALPFGSSLTYKHSLEGNGGQLTNGMGCCSPNYKLSLEQEYYLMDNVIYPTLDYLQISGNAYLGILGVNGILTEMGDVYILGWQSFMQDCDAAAILNNIDDDLYYLFESCIIGSFSDEAEQINLNNNQSISVVLNCKNKINNENIIQGLDKLDENTILTFFPQIKQNRYLEYETNYGAALIITSFSSSFAKTKTKVYEEIKDIKFDGMSFRKDICSVIL